MIKVPVEVSARHIHVSKNDLEKLFGQGHELTKLKDISQTGQFSCRETATLKTKKNIIKGVRIVGPIRQQTQVEISMTDAHKLRLNAPVRRSGGLEKTAKLQLIGDHGKINLNKGVIIPQRHIHASPTDARRYGLRDGQQVLVKVGGPRSLEFHQVVVRIDPSYVWRFQIDTDEANAAGISGKTTGEVII